ncbi:MAG: Plug domain-containing protein, partial [Gemmatimonadota bacterium]
PPPPPAQDPPPPDSLNVEAAPVDSLEQAADTLPPPLFVDLPGGRAPGWGAGTWRWDRDDLLMAGAITLADLLDGIPGVTTVRGGFHGQPQAAGAFGSTAPGLRVEVDGFVLDPLGGGAFDLARFALVNVDEVVVERRLDGLRIRLRTTQARDAEPYSRIEAGLGQPDANQFRGMLVVPHFLIGPLGLAIDRLETEGLDANEPAVVMGGWGSWGIQNERRGVRVEFIQSTVEREAESPWPVASAERRDMIVRARNRFLPGLTAEIFAGASSFDHPLPALPPEEEGGDSIPAELARESVAFGARVAGEGAWWLAEGALRGRTADELPGAELEGAVRLRPHGLVEVEGEVLRSNLAGAGATAWSARAAVQPLAGVGLFAEVSGGARVAPFFGPDSIRAGWREDRSGWRVGAEALRWGIHAGAAALRVNSDTVPPFDLPFDSAHGRFDGGAVNGLEAFVRAPLWRDILAAEGWIVELTGPEPLPPYLPLRTWRGVLEARIAPLESGNLDVLGRLEARHRSAMFAPASSAPVPPDPAGALTPALAVMEARTQMDGYLAIRIIDVLAYIRYEDFTGVRARDLPDRPVPGPRIFYGVKWRFRN